jgi:chromate transporter
LSRDEFLDLLGATNLIPGPNSTELALHISLQRAGWRGLFVAGTAFVAPSALMVAGLAVGYVRWGTLPAAVTIFAGIEAVMIAVVIHALVGLGRAAAGASAVLLWWRRPNPGWLVLMGVAAGLVRYATG